MSRPAPFHWQYNGPERRSPDGPGRNPSSSLSLMRTPPEPLRSLRSPHREKVSPSLQGRPHSQRPSSSWDLSCCDCVLGTGKDGHCRLTSSNMGGPVRTPVSPADHVPSDRLLSFLRPQVPPLQIRDGWAYSVRHTLSVQHVVKTSPGGGAVVTP